MNRLRRWLQRLRRSPERSKPEKHPEGWFEHLEHEPTVEI